MASEAASAAAPASAMASSNPAARERESEAGEAQRHALVLVFDYDWSLINENSDTYLFQQLHADAAEHLRSIATAPERRGDWTACVDEALVRMQTPASKDAAPAAASASASASANTRESTLSDEASRAGEAAAGATAAASGEPSPAVGVARIKECLARVPVLDGMLDALRLAAARPDCAVLLVSDANDVFIDVFLEHHGLRGAVAGVETNVAYTDDAGRLRVRAHVDAASPHACDLCPKNLCKGAVLDRLGLLASAKQIVYVGDGGGDFCPGLRLRPQDLLLVRDDEAYPYARGLAKRIAKHAEARPVRAAVLKWRTGHEVLAAVTAALDEHAPLAADSDAGRL